MGAFSSLISTTTAALLLLCIKECLNSAELENFDELLCKDHHDTTNIEGVIFYVEKISIFSILSEKKNTNFLDKDKK